MFHHYPSSIIGFHSCDREVGLRVLNGNDQLIPSKNSWDWLGPGIYFWEQNPLRALEYAIESSQRKQFNKVPINTPLVLGAQIKLRKCLNLVESDALKLLSQAYARLEGIFKDARKPMPVNTGGNKALDCAVIQYIHQSNIIDRFPAYDTIRCAFQEGEPVYPGATCSSRLHIQVCVINPECITGYFLPRPLEKFNPYLILPAATERGFL